MVGALYIDSNDVACMLKINCQARVMADIKLFVLCVAIVVVCLELQQGQAQGDV